MGERLSSNMIKRQIEKNQRRLQESCDASPGEHDSDSDRFLEDERYFRISASKAVNKHIWRVKILLINMCDWWMCYLEVNIFILLNFFYNRLALIMQNEEFLRELKRNEDFMRTLEFERGKIHYTQIVCVHETDWNIWLFFIQTCWLQG